MEGYRERGRRLQQWRTLWKAYGLGYITEGEGEGYCGHLTDQGRSELARLTTEHPQGPGMGQGSPWARGVGER